MELEEVAETPESAKKARPLWRRALFVAGVCALVCAALWSGVKLGSLSTIPPTADELRVESAGKAQGLTVYPGSVVFDQPDAPLLAGRVSFRNGDKTAQIYFWQLDKNTWVFGCHTSEGRLITVQELALSPYFPNKSTGCPAGAPPKTPSS